ncbi:hypothetical protein ACFTWM_03050 [Streptomyces bacillaris]|uniref:hypothetical protein n=1 Tax=Streptomyces bacillaris TaxID=68179 RepID=UPI003638F4E1
MGTTRKSVPLRDEEIAALERIADPDSPERAALVRLTHTFAQASPAESVIMQTLVSLGVKAVKDEMEAAAYEELAAAADDEDRAYEAAVRSRGRRRRSSVGRGEE